MAISLIEIGYFGIQVLIWMILFQGYQWLKAKVEISKIKANKERIILNNLKPKELSDLEDIQKPDTMRERIEHKLKIIGSKREASKTN